MGAFDIDFGALNAEIFNVADNSDSENDAVHRDITCCPALVD